LGPLRRTVCLLPKKRTPWTGRGAAVGERALYFFDYAPDATRHLIEVAELHAANRNEDGSLRPLSNHADRQLVTVAASQIIDRAWGKPTEFDPASEKPATPEFNPRDYSPDQLNIIEKALRLPLNPPGKQQPEVIELDWDPP
jgi:hypothetical protein